MNGLETNSKFRNTFQGFQFMIGSVSYTHLLNKNKRYKNNAAITNQKIKVIYLR